VAGEPDGGRASAATRRRGAVLEQAILDAAAEELKESGYSGLTMDRVARRAGTNKNAIYRRWPSRAALAVAAYGRMTVTEARVPDTGELRGDALELLRAANRHLSSPLGRILLDLLASARSLRSTSHAASPAATSNAKITSALFTFTPYVPVMVSPPVVRRPRRGCLGWSARRRRASAPPAWAPASMHLRNYRHNNVL